jgi:hypothetical protein
MENFHMNSPFHGTISKSMKPPSCATSPPPGDGAQGDAWTYTTGDYWGIIFHFEAEYQNVIF